MTDEQKLSIADLRRHGFGYRKIASRLGMSDNTIKSYISRSNIVSLPIIPETEDGICNQCGADLSEIKGRKNRKFCSEICRRSWWKSNNNLINRRAWYSLVCAGCGKTFKSYGNNKRKYCTHKCYISNRFKKGASL